MYITVYMYASFDFDYNIQNEIECSSDVEDSCEILPDDYCYVNVCACI